IGNVLPDGQGTYVIREFSKRTLLAGSPGAWPFYDDGSGQNNFYGTQGQLTRLIGGQGGGSGASATGADYCGNWCNNDSDSGNDNCCSNFVAIYGNYGDSLVDARGGGGGGGGGGVLIQALGAIRFDSTAKVDAHGGNGLGGEAINCSNFGGG